LKKRRKNKDSFDEESMSEAPSSPKKLTKRLLAKKQKLEGLNSNTNTMQNWDDYGTGDLTLCELPMTKKPRAKRINKVVETTETMDSPGSQNKPDISLPLLSSGPRTQRRKSTQHLAKLMARSKRKKRKKTSSGEDEDDSDEYEITSRPTKSKTTIGQNADTNDGLSNGPTLDADTNGDEEAAKLLQNENSRRSTRKVSSKRTKYADSGLRDEDLIIPATEAELAADAAADAAAAAAAESNIVLASAEALVIDKILGVRLFKRKTLRKKEKKSKDEENKSKPVIDIETDDLDVIVQQVVNNIVDKVVKEIEEEEYEELSEYEEDGGEIEVEEFYIKYKNISYCHCEWRSRDELFANDKRIDQKIKRFKLKKSQQQQMFSFNDWDDEDIGETYNLADDELFNPDYVKVDRILDVFDMEDAANPTGPLLRYYLVKWKTLPYDESTWELEHEIKDKTKIDKFHFINTMIPDVHLKHVPRPKPEKWRAMSESRIYKGNNKIREYQLEGINWLTFCWINGRNCILADEMGLGKVRIILIINKKLPKLYFIFNSKRQFKV
jgi:chromodomain-helicase-DNA-binding protein 7